MRKSNVHNSITGGSKNTCDDRTSNIPDNSDHGEEGSGSTNSTRPVQADSKRNQTLAVGARIQLLVSLFAFVSQPCCHLAKQ